MIPIQFIVNFYGNMHHESEFLTACHQRFCSNVEEKIPKKILNTINTLKPVIIDGSMQTNIKRQNSPSKGKTKVRFSPPKREPAPFPDNRPGR